MSPTLLHGEPANFEPCIYEEYPWEEYPFAEGETGNQTDLPPGLVLRG